MIPIDDDDPSRVMRLRDFTLAARTMAGTLDRVTTAMESLHGEVDEAEALAVAGASTFAAALAKPVESYEVGVGGEEPHLYAALCQGDVAGTILQLAFASGAARKVLLDAGLVPLLEKLSGQAADTRLREAAAGGACMVYTPNIITPDHPASIPLRPCPVLPPLPTSP